MAGESQKLKLLNLAKMLYERTDESHGLTCPEIIAGLAEAGIEAERKSVYRDLDALRDFGLDIAKLPTYPVSYALVSRTFTAAELMLLTDAVQSSRFLTVRMAHRLTEGLASLGSCHQAAALSKNVHVEGRIKMQNESVFHHVDTLHEAIRRHRQVAFRYVKHDVNKHPQPQGGGRIYCETPVCLIYSEGCYYLIAYNEKHDSFPSYRAGGCDPCPRTRHRGRQPRVLRLARPVRHRRAPRGPQCPEPPVRRLPKRHRRQLLESSNARPSR